MPNLSVISSVQPITFSIKIRSQASNSECGGNDDVSGSEDSEDESEDDEAKQSSPMVELKFELPSKYPDERPDYVLVSSQNLTENEINRIHKLIDEKIDESLGTVMIFTLVCELVEWFATNEADQIEEEKELETKRNASDEVKRLDGIPVTVQSFLAWKAKFDAELIKQKIEEQKQQVDPQGTSSSKRLTGRAMFESDKTLAESDLNFIDDLYQDQIEALMQNIDELDVGDLADENLDDEDDDDDDDDETFDCEDEESD